MNNDLSKTLKDILISILALAVIAFGIGLFWVDNILMWATGLLIGTAVSALKVFMLKRTLDKAVDMSPEDAKNYTRSRYTLRFVLSVVVVAVVFKVGCGNVFGVVIGLLLVQPAVYIVNFLNKRNK